MLNRGEPVLVYTFGGLCGGLAVTLAWGAREVAATDWAALPAIVWAAVLYLAALATATTFFLVQYATLRLPSAKVMAYGYLVPSFVILWEGLLGHGWVAAPVWLGVVATVGALLILLRD
jgi:drug/metabolite transporter (DMT)-like permease